MRRLVAGPGGVVVRDGVKRLKTFKPGDVVLWDGLAPTEVEIAEPFYKRTLMFPRDRVLAVCPRLAELKALSSFLEGAVGVHVYVKFIGD